MKRLLISLLAASAASSAFAQHEGHGEPAPSARGRTPVGPAAACDASKPPAQHEAADSHAGHETSTPSSEQQPADVHAGHNSNAVPEPTDPHAGHAMEVMQDAAAAVPESSPPAAAFSGPVHAADTIFDPRVMADSRELLRAEQGGFRTHLALADRFETRIAEGEESYLWDLQGWYGSDINKVWLKSEGEGDPGNNPEEIELQALYSRAVTPFFDFQAGIRYDLSPNPERSHLVLGIQGLLPQVFELDAAAFLSDEGDVTGRVEAEYDLRIKQRLVLQPRIELAFAGQAIPELGIGSGLGSVAGGFRLRYEIRREIAPYVGIDWEGKFGATADFARVAGEDRRVWGVVLGMRSWF